MEDIRFSPFSSPILEREGALRTEELHPLSSRAVSLVNYDSYIYSTKFVVEGSEINKTE